LASLAERPERLSLLLQIFGSTRFQEPWSLEEFSAAGSSFGPDSSVFVIDDHEFRGTRLKSIQDFSSTVVKHPLKRSWRQASQNQRCERRMVRGVGFEPTNACATGPSAQGGASLPHARVARA